MGVRIRLKCVSLAIAAFGYLWCLLLVIVAENQKPAVGIAVLGPHEGVFTCIYRTGPTEVLGFLSVASFAASALIGCYAIFYPYKGKAVPRSSSIFQSKTCIVLLYTTHVFSGSCVVMLLWTTITEMLHLSSTVHHNTKTICPTAETGLFGDGSFPILELIVSWIWRICLMLAEGRGDYFTGGEDEDLEGDYVQLYETEFATNGQAKM